MHSWIQQDLAPAVADFCRNSAVILRRSAVQPGRSDVNMVVGIIKFLLQKTTPGPPRRLRNDLEGSFKLVEVPTEAADLARRLKVLESLLRQTGPMFQIRESPQSSSSTSTSLARCSTGWPLTGHCWRSA